METAWIKVFVLTLAQCVAPAGKLVCQEEIVEYHFVSEDDCTRALEQMIDFAARADNVLVDRAKSSCNAGAVESAVYTSGSDTGAPDLSARGLARVKSTSPPPDFLQVVHSERLQGMKTCEDTSGVAPCKIGSIIIEAATEQNQAEVWQQQE
jgi:hypothetical protein